MLSGFITLNYVHNLQEVRATPKLFGSYVANVPLGNHRAIL